jgi:hypothetical protein
MRLAGRVTQPNPQQQCVENGTVRTRVQQYSSVLEPKIIRSRDAEALAVQFLSRGSRRDKPATSQYRTGKSTLQR